MQAEEVAVANSLFHSTPLKVGVYHSLHMLCKGRIFVAIKLYNMTKLEFAK